MVLNTATGEAIERDIATNSHLLSILLTLLGVKNVDRLLGQRGLRDDLRLLLVGQLKPLLANLRHLTHPFAGIGLGGTVLPVFMTDLNPLPGADVVVGDLGHSCTPSLQTVSAICTISSAFTSLVIS